MGVLAQVTIAISQLDHFMMETSPGCITPTHSQVADWIIQDMHTVHSHDKYNTKKSCDEVLREHAVAALEHETLLASTRGFQGMTI